MNVDDLVQDFAMKLSALLTRQMRDALQGAGNIASPPKNATNARIAKRGKGEKRTAAEMEQLRSKLLRAIDDNPGKRTEELNAALGTSTKDLALPLRQLVGEKLVRTEGERRGTRYFITSKGAKS